MNKEIYNKNEIRSSILKGVGEISEIVKTTLGPGGRPVLIERLGQALDGSPLGPQITKDGVTVAEQCFSPIPMTDLVIQSVKTICRKTNQVAGDGTTTAIILGESLLVGALNALDKDPSLNPQLLRESIEQASFKAIELLRKEITKVDDLSMVESVATISANGDKAIGAIIKKAFDKVGSEGVITVDEGHSDTTTIEIVDGFQINKGAEAQDRFFNNKDNTKFEAENVHVILLDGKLFATSDLLPVFNVIGEHAKAVAKDKSEASGQPVQPVFPPTVVIANEFSQEVLQFLLIQRAQGGLSVCAVKSPQMTTTRTATMDDIAIMVGGTRLGNGNKTLTTATYDDVGVVSRIVVSKYSATFYDGQGAEEEVIARVDQLKAAKAEAESPYDASLIADRIAALSQGVAKIGVGGSTDMEMKERYHRIEDALNSARAAVDEGIIPGGGTSLLKVASALPSKTPSLGETIVAEALLAPINQIIENVGEEPKSIITKEFIAGVKAGKGLVYDARIKKVVNALEAGIIDPFKVTKAALENATSIAALLTTCGGGIVFTRPKN